MFFAVNIVVVLDDDGVAYNVVSDCVVLINDYAFVNVVFLDDYAIVVVVVHDNIVSNSIIVLNEVVLNDVVFVI